MVIIVYNGLFSTVFSMPSVNILILSEHLNSMRGHCNWIEMESYKKERLQLLMIFGSICLSIMYINNPIINEISFRSSIHRFLPFLAQYNPVTISLIFVIVCFGIAFLSSNKSIPKQNHTSENQSSDVKPIVQTIIIKPIIEQPVNSSGHTIEQAETHPGHIQTQNKYHTSKPKKTMIYNYYDRKNRKRFHWWIEMKTKIIMIPMIALVVISVGLLSGYIDEEGFRTRTLWSRRFRRETDNHW